MPIHSKNISNISEFPKQIGFSACKGGKFDEIFKEFIEKGEISIAITNAMSNALGDHMIGMKALKNFREELSKYIPNDKIIINLFQLSPDRLRPITQQWEGVWQQIFIMPSKLNILVAHDAMIDFGGLLTYENFGNQSLMDFFEDAFSTKGLKISPERRRMSYTPDQSSKEKINSLMKIVRRKANGRKIVLYHHLSTTPIRSIPNSLAKIHVEEIINKSDFFVVSALGIDFENDRFLNLNNYSKGIDEFASIISECDGVITVDTLALHLSDVFSKPTVAIFSGIDPEKRCSDYPFVKSISLEKEGGLLKGQHKIEFHLPCALEKIEHSKKLFKSLNIEEVISKLKNLGLE